MMDKTTHQVRSANWKSLIEQCQARPEGQTAKQWLADNNVSEKQYYYWLRKMRKEAYEDMHTSLPATVITPDKAPSLPAVSYASFSTKDLLDNDVSPAVVIRTEKSTIEISSAVSEKLMVKLVKAVAHAL